MCIVHLQLSEKLLKCRIRDFSICSSLLFSDWFWSCNANFLLHFALYVHNWKTITFGLFHFWFSIFRTFFNAIPQFLRERAFPSIDDRKFRPIYVGEGFVVWFDYWRTHYSQRKHRYSHIPEKRGEKKVSKNTTRGFWCSLCKHSRIWCIMQTFSARKCVQNRRTQTC